MLSRLAARLVTGRVAYFAATAIDIGWFVIASLAHRLRERIGPVGK